MDNRPGVHIERPGNPTPGMDRQVGIDLGSSLTPMESDPVSPPCYEFQEPSGHHYCILLPLVPATQC